MQTEQQKVRSLKADVIISIGLSVFIILLGVVEILPDRYLPEGTLFLCAGVILLLVSLMIEFKRLDHVGFHVIFGLVLLFNGVNKILDMDIKVMPAFLIVIGFAYFCSLSMDKFKNTRDEVNAYVKTTAGKGT